MKITRQGHSADYGQYSIDLRSPHIKWDGKESNLLMLELGILDFSKRSRHDYFIRISIEEIGKIIQVVADEAMKEPLKFEHELASALKAINQLQAVVSGLRSA